MDEKDPRLIVTLEADGTTAERAWNRPQNQDRCLPASESVVDISSRESTPAVEQPASQIQLTFNDKPKDLEKGFVFGSDPQICDVFLGERGAGFSGRQFCITFNERGDVIFKNTSRKKAHVDYNGESPQFRNQFTWILFDTYKDIIITLGEKDKLIFKVKWPKYRDSHRAEYEAYREAYFQERRNALPPLSQLGMESQQTTVVPTAQQSPRQGSPRPKPSGQQTIYLSEEELGRGGFGTVYKAVDVSTGDVYAAKKFDHGNWKKEVDILMRLSHERIVKFVNFSEEQKPLLVMEYLPLGNLVCQDFITEEETLQVLYQGLEALEYLHSYSPSLAHRDIKPANILVQSRMPFAIKLADFGFAKNDSSLKTFCGSNEYAAPEIWGCHHYTAMVDIWSLGVVVLEYAYGLPQPTRERKGKPWCRDIVKAAEDGEDGDTLIDLISTKMLRMNYQDRLSASDCLEQVYRLGFHRVQTCDTGLATPTGKSTRDLQDGTHFYSKSTLSKRQRQQTVQSASDDAGGRGPSKRSRASVSFEAGEAMPAVTDFNERYVQITIDDKTVLMRKGDCLLNATQILTFANTNRNDRASILKIMKEQTVLEKVSPAVGILWRHSWVNFQHGRILCKHLKLEQELKSLIDYGLEAQYDDRSKTAEPVHDYITERFPPFFTINVLPQPVTVRKFDLRVNVNHICQASNQPKGEILRIREAHSRGYDIVIDAEYHQSTYVDLWIAVDLCRRYGLAELEGELRNLKGVPHEPVKEPEPSKPVKQPELLESIEITGYPNPVMVRMSDFRVNASHVAKMAGRSRTALANFRKTLNSEVYDILLGDMKRQGTYVDFDVGIRLCRKYKLPELEERLHSLKRTSEGQVLEAEPSHVRPRPSELDRVSARTQSSGIGNRDQPPTSPRGPTSNESTEAEDADEMDSGSDMEGSGASVTSHEPRPIQQNLQPMPSIRRANDATSLHPSGRDIDRSLSELADPHSLTAKKSVQYEVWDSRPQLSKLTEVKPELKPSSWETASHYGSLPDLYDVGEG